MSACELCEQDTDLYYLPVCPGRACADCFKEHLRECRACDELEQALQLSDHMHDARV
jgi:hypothetical protein